MCLRHYLTLVLVFVALIGSSQGQDVFLGAGNNSAITVTASNEHQLYGGLYTASGDKTVDGSGLNARRMEASRFLAQAALGFNDDMIDVVLEHGFENWIDSQFVKPPTFLTDSMSQIFDQSKQIWTDNGNDPNDYPSRPNHVHMDYAWWQVSVLAEDVLRQRVAEALSQIIVVSLNSSLSGLSLGMSTYYDLLIEHALGNYEDLLQDITLCAGMGIYLTYVNNPKSDSIAMTFPDENYSRECMQLFTIGLDKLNSDGTPQLDTMGNAIPTYDNDDIAEFAKIFTGLGYGDRIDEYDPYFGMGMYNADLTVPMIMYEDYHEPGPKYLLDGYVIPDGQTGMEDVEEAITHLFNHANVGPFLAIRLIQRLVKSNPSPGYVSAVAAAFDDNGQGVRGDMKAVVKAILLHPEARGCVEMQDPEHGRLREPILKKTAFRNMYGVITPLPGKYWNYSYWFQSDTDMHPMRSPSVFNFYAPSFSPNGPVSDAGLVAPEFGIYNSRTSIGYANQVYRWIDSEQVLRTSWYENSTSMPGDLSILLEYSKDPDALIDYLDLTLAYGQLSEPTREIIKTTLSEFGLSINDLVSRVSLATYLVLISPDFNILK